MTAESIQHHTKQLHELLQHSTSLAQKSAELIGQFLRHHPQSSFFDNTHNLQDLVKRYEVFWQALLADPSKLVEMQLAYWQDVIKLWQSTANAWFSGSKINPIITPAPGDKRFKDNNWDTLPLFAFIKQAYLLYAQHILGSVQQLEGVDDKILQQIEFYLRQHVNALSPTNFIATNPAVLKATLDSHGQNLLNGLKNILADLSNSPTGMLKISMTDMSAFAVGRNLAITPGKVIFQNDMMELIQYTPTTKTVYSRPVIIVPPWINKYYILDMTSENSLVKYLVDQGLTVFIISWINPTARHRNKSFDAYMQEGLLTAIEKVQMVTDEKTVNVTGYCIGGTLLAGTLAYLAAKQQKIIHTATYLTTLIDFREPGELGVFIDEPQVQSLEARMAKQGYLEGSQMASTFNLLRSNELIWSFFINNYLLGKEPFPFDLLYWNSDNTNLPYAMHSFYLRKMYMENIFCRPNGIKLNDTPIDIQKITVPAFFLSTQEDHIAPWRSTYYGALLHRGPTEFVLGGSGHVAGVVNPPVKQKYAFWTNAKLPNNPEQWLAHATENAGSWWPYWVSWLSKQSGEKIAARQPGSGPLKALAEAPGSYVRSSHDAPTKESASSATSSHSITELSAKSAVPSAKSADKPPESSVTVSQPTVADKKPSVAPQKPTMNKIPVKQPGPQHKKSPPASARKGKKK